MTTPTRDEAVRQQFEAWFREPPYEFPMKRGTADAGWPGQYRDYSVQCAWEGYQAALSSPAVVALVAAGDFLAMNGTDGMVRRWEAAKAAINGAKP